MLDAVVRWLDPQRFRDTGARITRAGDLTGPVRGHLIRVGKLAAPVTGNVLPASAGPAYLCPERFRFCRGKISARLVYRRALMRLRLISRAARRA